MPPSENHSPDSADLQAWARATLELPADIVQVDARTAILQRLAECELVPHQEWNDAIDVLIPAQSAGPAATPLDYYCERESAVRDQVERFAREFFDLEPTARRERWELLARLGAPWGPVRVCLARLKTGLDLEIPDDLKDSTAMRDVGSYVRCRFVQWAGQLNDDYTILLKVVSDNKRTLRPAIRRFQRKYPALAQFFDAWIVELIQYAKKAAADAAQGFLSPNKWANDLRLRVVVVCVLSVLSCVLGYVMNQWMEKTNRSPRRPSRSVWSRNLTQSDLKRLVPAIESLDEKDRSEIGWLDAVLSWSNSQTDASTRLLTQPDSEKTNVRLRKYEVLRAAAERPLDSGPLALRALGSLGGYPPEILRIVRSKQLATPEERAILTKFIDSNMSDPSPSSGRRAARRTEWVCVAPILSAPVKSTTPSELLFRNWSPPYIDRIKFLGDKASPTELQQLQKFELLKLEMLKFQTTTKL